VKPIDKNSKTLPCWVGSATKQPCHKTVPMRELQLIAMFCDIDDFCKTFIPVYTRHLLHAGPRRRQRQAALALSEIMTILVYFHGSHYRTFKHYYLDHVGAPRRPYFPQLVSYPRFIELLPQALGPLCCYLHTRKGRCTGMAFIDSTPLAVCHNRRIAHHKVFEGWATRGKTSMGWFFGFKLHLIVNDAGELLAFQLTPGHVDDRRPVSELAKGLCGQLFGDRGYISQVLHDVLGTQGLELLTTVRKDMKNRLMRLWDKLLLRKRVLIETINEQLKNISQIEHTRPRSVPGFMVNLVAGLSAYSYRPKKPSRGLRREPQLLMLRVELTRTRVRKWIRNRSACNQTARAQFPPSSMKCDEYPFASVWEGGPNSYTAGVT
jgi:DDE family transposase